MLTLLQPGWPVFLIVVQGRYLGTCSPDQARIDISDNGTRLLTTICQVFSTRSADQRMALGFARLSVLAALCRQHPNEAALI